MPLVIPKDVAERLRRNAARKSNLDRDKELLEWAADEIDRLRAALGSAKVALMNRPRNLDLDWERVARAAEKDIDATLEK